MDKKNTIHVLIIGDEEQLNSRLVDAMNKRELNSLTNNSIRFSINAFNNYKAAAEYLSKEKNKTIPTFVFLDYFGGNGISGPHLVKILKEQYAHAEVIFLSSNEEDIGEVQQQTDTNQVYDYVIKDDYTPTLCRLLLEKYVEKYS
jgi:DNA-binding NtrC family response regulator